MRHSARPVLAHVLLIVSLVRPAGADTAPVALAFKATPAPVDYKIHTSRMSKREGFTTTAPPDADTWQFYDTREVVRQSVIGGGDGKLTVRVESLSKELTVNGVPMRGYSLPLPTFTYRMSPRGERAGPGADDLAVALSPILPDKPASPGLSWEARVPPSKKFPQPVKLTHSFDEMETIQGERCAVISTRAEVVAKDPDLAYRLHVHGMTKFGVDTGQLVEAWSTTEFNTRAIKGRFKAGHRTQRQSVRRTILRIPPGAGVAAPGGD